MLESVRLNVFSLCRWNCQLCFWCSLPVAYFHIVQWVRPHERVPVHQVHPFVCFSTYKYVQVPSIGTRVVLIEKMFLDGSLLWRRCAHFWKMLLMFSSVLEYFVMKLTWGVAEPPYSLKASLQSGVRAFRWNSISRDSGQSLWEGVWQSSSSLRSQFRWLAQILQILMLWLVQISTFECRRWWLWKWRYCRLHRMVHHIF